jgi:hypothetical protein
MTAYQLHVSLAAYLAANMVTLRLLAEEQRGTIAVPRTGTRYLDNIIL